MSLPSQESDHHALLADVLMHCSDHDSDNDYEKLTEEIDQLCTQDFDISMADLSLGRVVDDTGLIASLDIQTSLAFSADGIDVTSAKSTPMASTWTAPKNPHPKTSGQKPSTKTKKCTYANRRQQVLLLRQESTVLENTFRELQEKRSQLEQSHASMRHEQLARTLAEDENLELKLAVSEQEIQIKTLLDNLLVPSNRENYSDNNSLNNF